MKLGRMSLFVLVAVASVALRDIRAAEVSVGVEINSPGDFYEPLATQGYWVEVGTYGRCWHPSYVEASWRPYCEGTWVWTDDGWYWQSDEPWAWACYHYGRWYNDPYYSWVWVPDVEWGPAWVCFREGGGYCGWAPLPPGWHGGVAIGVDIVPSTWFVFVGEHHFGERHHARDVIVNNTTIVNRTTIINRTRTTVNNRVIADGPRVQDLQRVNHERIQTSTVQTMRQHERTPPITHRAVTQPAVQRENERPARPAPEPERQERKQPEIIRGPPNTPGSPAERKEPVQQRPAEPPSHEGSAPPPQRQAPPPQERREPPPEHREAPPERREPPPQENRGDEHGHEGEQGH